MVDQEEIHNQCLCNNPQKRINALEQLKIFFSSMPDKQEAWNDLHRLTNDKDSDVKSSAALTLGSVFFQVPNKQQAWNDLHRLTNDEDSNVRAMAIEALGSSFSQVLDKQQAWNDLLRLTNDEDGYVKYSAAKALGSAFSQMPDKQQAWNDFHRLTNDEDSDVKSSAALAFGSVFFQVPNKQQAWDDLHRLTNDEDSNVRYRATKALGSSFSQVSDKQQAWNDLLRLTTDENSDVKYRATKALGSSFSQVPDKQQAWDDFHRLTNDEDRSVRAMAVEALGSVFSCLPDKQQAWNDLHRLTNDKDSDVRYRATKTLGSVFFQVPDKQQAWNDLHRLTNDENSDVKYRATKALGSSFSQVPDKQQAFNDLHRLTSDEDSLVRTSSNHSLGRISIFMASQAETDEDYKKELEKAIEFFEIAAKEASYYNPTQFCLPFYRSFYTIIFKKQEAKEEVNKYLKEAKNAIRDSESKKQLFEAVENLAEALIKVQNLGDLDLQAMKGELNFYREYCDHAAELMRGASEKAPLATEVLRKGLPILDRNLKELLGEIQKKAKIACKESKGTNAEIIACTVNQEVQKWEIGSQEEMTQKVEDVAYMLKTKVADLPENDYVLNKIEAMRSEKNLIKQYETLLFVIGLIPQIVPEIRSTVKNAGGIMGTRENVSKTYTTGDVHGTVIQGEYIINNSVIIIPSPSNSITNKKADVLLVTATKVESKAVLDIFQKTIGEEPHLMPIGDQIYYDIGSVNGKSVVLVQSEMGSGGLGASPLTLEKAIIDLSPNEVIMVGIAFGIDPEKQLIGDILVSKQLMLYEFQRVGTKEGSLKIIPRGDKAPASTRLLKYFRNADLLWNESKCKISFGLILSGEKLVDNLDFRQQLCDLYPKAIGGEMEGAGLYVACHDKKVDWIIVKAICDWANGKRGENKEVKQELAAKNAASFVLHALQLVSFTERP